MAQAEAGAEGQVAVLGGEELLEVGGPVQAHVEDRFDHLAAAGGGAAGVLVGVVGGGQLPLMAGESHGQAARGVDGAGEDVGDDPGGGGAQVPGGQDGAGLLDPLLDDEGAPAHEDDGDGRAGGDGGAHEGRLASGQVEVGTAGGLAGELAGLVEGEDDEVRVGGGRGDGGDVLVGDAQRVLPAQDGEGGDGPAALGGVALEGRGQGDVEAALRRGGEVLDPGPQVVGVGGGRAGQEDAAGGGGDRQGAVVGQQDGALLGGGPGGGEVGPGGGGDLGALVDVGVLEQAQGHFEGEDAAHGVVDAGDEGGVVVAQEGGGLRAGGGVVEMAAHLDVEAGGQGGRGGVGQVGGHPVGDEVLHSGGVADDRAGEAELALEDAGEQAPAGVDGAAVDRVEGGHDGPGAGLDAGGEGRQVDAAQALVGHVHGVVVAPALGGAVADVVLGGGDDGAGGAEPLALVAGDHGGAHLGAQERVLAEALGHAPPPRVAGDVDHGRVGPRDAAGAGLGGGDGGAGAGDVGAEGGGHGQGRGEDGALAVDDVQSDEQGDAVRGLLDGGALDGVGVRGASGPEQGADAPAGRLEALLQAHLEGHLRLIELLLPCQGGEDVLDALALGVGELVGGGSGGDGSGGGGAGVSGHGGAPR